MEINNHFNAKKQLFDSRLRSKKSKNTKKILLEIFVFLASLLIVAISVFLIWVSSFSMPDFNTIATRQLESTTKIYDKTGKILLFAFREKIRRTPVAATDISPNLVKATLAIEDSNFYLHSGISFRGIIRAFYVNLTTDKVQGGSTITQQVVKNALLTQDRTIERKIKEVILSLKLEQSMSKDDILLMYLNDNPYGGEIYGVEEASLYYFNKRAKDLTLTESAYLAAIPKNPPLYSPYIGKIEKLEERKNLVLQRMFETGVLTQEEYTTSLNEKVAFVKKSDNNSKAHHFVFYVRDILEKNYGSDFLTKGYSVKTTLDFEMQKELELVTSNYIESYIKRNGGKTRGADINALNTGTVVLDSKTGQILTMIGSRDYFDEKIDGKYNIATAQRQPGSAIKPLVYALAFENGLDPESYVFDTPTEFNPSCPPADGTRREAPCYSPQNYDGNFMGAMTLRDALGNSRNIPAVKVLYLVGVNNVTKFAKKLGITSMTQPERYGLSLVLGGAEVSLLQLTSSYLPFGQDGIYRKPVAILEIKNSVGDIIYEYEDSGYQVMSQDTAGKITSTLSDNAARSRVFGANNQMYFPGRDVAVKTGTTNNFKDGWVVGYTTDFVIGSWIGKNDNTPIGEVTASLSIVPMWNQMVYKLFSKKEPGTLSKDYTPNQKVSGPNCKDGTAYDLIYTAITLGSFGLSNNSPLLKYWYVGNSSVCGQATDTAGTSSAVTTDPNFPQTNIPVIQLPNTQTIPLPTGITTPPQN